MPNKTKKDKDAPKTKGNKSGGQENSEHESSNRKNSNSAPPTTQLLKGKQPGPQTPLKKDKRQSSSRFSLSNNRELQKLPAFKVSLGSSPEWPGGTEQEEVNTIGMKTPGLFEQDPAITFMLNANSSGMTNVTDDISERKVPMHKTQSGEV